MGKWVAGVAAAVVASLIVWAVTQKGILTTPKHHLEVLSFSVSPAPVLAGQTVTGTVQLHNGGDLPAEQCPVFLVIEGSETGRSEVFGLAKDGQRPVEVHVAAPGQTGPHSVSGRVTCSGFSEELRQQQITVASVVAQPVN
jgi:hypothetical protein